MKNINTLEKKLSTVIDQREFKLPPTWVANVENNEMQNSHNQNKELMMTSGNDKYLSKSIVKMLNSAKSTAIVCSFLLAENMVEDAINNAAERGVRVYLMLACETRLDNDNPDDYFGKKCLNQHTAMLKRLAGKVMIRSASFYHAKAVLVDAIGNDQSNKQGLLLTANLTTEALERNEELAVILSQSEIEEMVSIFKWALFENSEHQMLDDSNFKSVKPLGEVDHPSKLDSILSTTNKSNSILNHALKLINNAKSKLIISSFGWQEDHQITDAICKKAKQGVSVVILTRIRPSSMQTLIKLKTAGANIFGFKWLHAKAIWNESNDAMIMSANLQHYGLDSGFELGVKLNGKRAENLKGCLLGFLKRQHSELLLDANLGDQVGIVKTWESESGQLVDVEIKKIKTESLESVTSKCASLLEEQAAIPNVDWVDLPFHKIKYEWMVKAPLLPKGAKELFWEENKSINKEKLNEKRNKQKMIKRSYSPKVYKTSGASNVIGITNQNKMQDAIKLKNESFSNANIVMIEG